MDILQVKEVKKKYPTFCLNNISFRIPAGTIMGYVGQNGAGKTTTLKALMGLIKKDEGEIKVLGQTFEEDELSYKDKIGFVGDASYFPECFTVREISSILKTFYKSFDEKKFDAFIERWDLPVRAKVKEFSGGMLVKLMFAAVLSRDTNILILDEATNGLDPLVRKDILGLLRDYVEDGSRAILFSTHIMEDLQDIADYIFFIDKGEKVFCDTKDAVLEKYILVKGGLSDLNESLERYLIGVDKNSFGFEALYCIEDDFILPPTLVTEKADIDKIIVHLLSERRQHD